MFATSHDISDAYHHIPMRENSHVYFCFQIKDKRYMYLVLPFGHMTAPWAFTQVVKQIKIWPSSHHLILFQYLDDWLNLFRSRGRARVWTLRLVRPCEQLGLLVNQEKSELQPTQSIVFPGEWLDLVLGRASKTKERRQVVVPVLEQALSHQGLEFPAAQSLLGQLSATAHTIPLGRMHMRPFQLDVIRQVRTGRNVGAWVPVKGQPEHALQWWTHGPLCEVGIPFQVAPPQEIVFTDASSKGWSIAFKGTMWSGTWQRSGHHINLLELRAVSVAIQLLQFRLKGETTIFMTDNAATVSYLEKWGGGDVARVAPTIDENTVTGTPAAQQHGNETY